MNATSGLVNELMFSLSSRRGRTAEPGFSCDTMGQFFLLGCCRTLFLA